MEGIHPGVRNFFSPDAMQVQSGLLPLKRHYPPAFIPNLFIAHNAPELFYFCHYNPVWIQVPGYAEFLVLNHSQNRQAFMELISPFKNARIHTVFGADLSGRVWDCKISLWLNGLDALFFLNKGYVDVNLNGRRLSFPETLVSSDRLFKAIGQKHAAIVHKPKSRAASFQDKFRLQPPNLPYS